MFAEAAAGVDEEVIDRVFAEQRWSQGVVEGFVAEELQGGVGDFFWRLVGGTPRVSQFAAARVDYWWQAQRLLQNGLGFFAVGDETER